MNEKYLETSIKWLQDKWEYLKFLWQHDHYFICTDERPLNLPSSERWYWHIEKCWCGRRQTTLTGWCDGNTPQS